MRVGPFVINRAPKKSARDSAPEGSGLRLYGDTMMVRGKRGPLWEESALGAVIRFACDTFPEAPLQVTTEDKEKLVAIKNHALTRLIKRPNPFYSGLGLLAGSMLSAVVDGNAYWRKVFTKGGQLAELWYVPHWRIKPWWPSNGAEFITKYIYTVRGQQEDVDPSEIVHFRVGLNPENDGRTGITRVKAITQEILTDAEAAVAAHAMMKGRGIPGAIIRPSKGDKESSGEEITITDDQRRAIENKYEQITGQGRGGILTFNMPLDVDFPSIDVEKMVFEKIRAISSERICAAVGIDPMVVGLPSQNKTYSNYGEAREAAYESFIIPMQRMFSETLDLQLLPEIGNPEAESVGFDLRQVRVLQKDENERSTRIGTLYQQGVIPRRMAQETLGFEKPAADDVYIQEASLGTTEPLKAIVLDAHKRAAERRAVVEVGDED